MSVRSRLARAVARARRRPRTSEVVSSDSPQTHEEIAAYWDDERMRRAVPREQRRER